MRAQAVPVVLCQVEVPAEIEQGDLADLLADAGGGDQAIGKIGFGSGFVPRRGFADKHGQEVTGRGVLHARRSENIMALHSK
jgi:hypothetical protein